MSDPRANCEGKGLCSLVEEASLPHCDHVMSLTWSRSFQRRQSALTEAPIVFACILCFCLFIILGARWGGGCWNPNQEPRMMFTSVVDASK